MTTSPASNDAWPVTFTDIAAEAGLVHPHVRRRRSQAVHHRDERIRRGARRRGRRRLAGCLRVERNQAEGRRREDAAFPAAEAPTNRLYRNTRKGRFEDVTDLAGLRRTGWASGVCAGDYDNDGWTDLFVTYFGHNVLYRNRGAGRFEDVTIGAGLAADGAMGIRVHVRGHRSRWPSRSVRVQLPPVRSEDGARAGEWRELHVEGDPGELRPEGLPTDTNLLYRNDGNGRFVDVSESSGIARVTGRYPMTALAPDMDGDAWTDIYVASIRLPRFSIATIATARSRTSPSKAGPRTAIKAARRPAWAWRRGTTTTTD